MISDMIVKTQEEVELLEYGKRDEKKFQKLFIHVRMSGPFFKKKVRLSKKERLFALPQKNDALLHFNQLKFSRRPSTRVTKGIIHKAPSRLIDRF